MLCMHCLIGQIVNNRVSSKKYSQESWTHTGLVLRRCFISHLLITTVKKILLLVHHGISGSFAAADILLDCNGGCFLES